MFQPKDSTPIQLHSHIKIYLLGFKTNIARVTFIIESLRSFNHIPIITPTFIFKEFIGDALSSTYSNTLHILF